MQGLHALFTGEDSTWEAWLNVDASGFSSIINLGGNGVKLRRGYAASLSPKPTQVSFYRLFYPVCIHYIFSCFEYWNWHLLNYTWCQWGLYHPIYQCTWIFYVVVKTIVDIQNDFSNYLNQFPEQMVIL